MLPFYLFASVESDLNQRINDCRDIGQKLSLTCSQDVYIYYYLLGLETGYTDCLKMVLEDQCH